MKATKCAFGGKECQFPEIKIVLMVYLYKTRNNEYAVLTEMLRTKEFVISRGENLTLVCFGP